MEAAKIEGITTNNLKDIKGLNISYKEKSFMLIYGRRINGYWLCIPDWNISCKLGNPADGTTAGYNVCSLAEAFKKTGWNHNDSTDAARVILGIIYDYENHGEKICS